MQNEGKGGIIETEWVPTGAGFALGHPLAQHLGAIWLVVAWLTLQTVAAVLWLADIVLNGRSTVLIMVWVLFLILLILNNGFAALTVIGRHPLAWHPVWISLILGVPLTLPLVMYWADGLRPNLIYRHRFGRLVRPEANR